ncbi:MAG: hypothetical protein LN408_04900 [Candidatus Thermoplasmatota archaeon]|nr:hypothetical protein [Candidatus Thermoplasmatota archaeon]
MAKGFCSSCNQQVGGFGKPRGLKCPSCGKMYCQSCSPQRGLIKSSYCPSCGVKLLK